jgi:hypothetical protein
MSTFIFSEEQFYWKKSNELLINVVEVCGNQSQPRGVNINFRSCPGNNQTCELTPNSDIVSMKITAYTATNSYKYSFDTLQGLSQTFISFEGRIPYNNTITSIKVGEVVSNFPVYNQTYVVNEPVLCGMVNCLTTLNIEGIYLGSTDDLDLIPGNYVDPCINDGQVITRTTNNAVFEIYLNSIYVGDLLLNNGGGTGTNAVTPGGKYICYDYSNLPNSLSLNNRWPGTTSSRYSKISINKSKAEEILQQRNGMNVNFYFYPAVTTVDRVPGCYGDIPNYESNWVRITKNTTTVLYNQCLISSSINNIPINVCGI